MRGYTSVGDSCVVEVFDDFLESRHAFSEVALPMITDPSLNCGSVLRASTRPLLLDWRLLSNQRDPLAKTIGKLWVSSGQGLNAARRSVKALTTYWKSYDVMVHRIY